MSDTPTFGIDLGTTKSAIGWVRDGRPTLIPVDGDVLVPSVVHLPAGGAPIVGRPAVAFLPTEPERTIHSAKRWMGSAHAWTVDGASWTPVDVSAAILRHLARAAELATGVAPRRVVITVPAWFSQAQRADTRRAGELAGLEVVRLLNEPTAAALAHAHGASVHRTVLVYDLGGGTFDASLVDQDGPLLEVRASHGDTWLGGDDVDAALIAWLLDRLDAQGEPTAWLRGDPTARARLRASVESAKILLAEQPVAEVEIPGRDAPERLTLEDLEEVVLPLFQRTLASVDRVLADAGRAPSQVDRLLLVGGSTGLPLVWRGLRKRYGLEGDASVPPRLAVALGACIQAGLIDGAEVDSVLIDVAPYALSIGMATGGVPGFPTHLVCEVVTPRNAPLPSRHTLLVRTNHPTQDRIRIPLFQGSEPDPRANVMLGEIAMEGLPPAPINELHRPIAVELRHDLDGQVHVSVIDQLTGRTVDGVVAADGAEQAELRARWEAFAREQDLAFGDPYLPSGSARPDGPAHLPEAEARFRQVVAHHEALRASHPALVDVLMGRVLTGREALARGDVAAARELWQQLEDDLFEACVYL
jgi:molecular chaperone DnaK